MIISVTPASNLATILEPAVQILSRSRLVAIPTETVYGLAANALDSAAVNAIYTAKNRPPDNPLIVHIGAREMLQPLLPKDTRVPECYRELMDRFWPGPLTIILPAAATVPRVVTAGLDTVAVRYSSHSITTVLINACGFPLAAPSANKSGRPSPTTAQHVINDFGSEIDCVIDGGQCEVGLESTIVDGLGPEKVILRPGAISLEQIQSCRGWENTRIYSADDNAAPRAPGMKYRHYAPQAPVMIFKHGISTERLKECMEMQVDSASGKMRVGLLHLGAEWPVSLPECVEATSYSLGEDATTAGQRLFDGLRAMDTMDAVWVLGMDEKGVGGAVMNRLRKASTREIH